MTAQHCTVSQMPSLTCFEGLSQSPCVPPQARAHMFWRACTFVELFGGPFNSFCAFEMHASPAVPVAEVAAEVLQGPTSTLAGELTWA